MYLDNDRSRYSLKGGRYRLGNIQQKNNPKRNCQ